MKPISLICILLYSLLNASCFADGQIDTIRYIQSAQHPDPKQSYFVELLSLALAASKDKYGEYQLEPISYEMAQGRASMMLQRNELIDVHWRMTSKSLESKLQAIYFPILKGLMGYRIFIIRKEDQPLFEQINSLAELKKLPLGQGLNWPDSEILLSNGFNVIKGYDIYLLKMLKRERFDYFPRALHEPWLEIADEPNLMVEQGFMLKYPAPTYFFVNKKNKRLSDRLTLGFERLLNSGKFELYFQNHAITSNILAKAKLGNRRVFQLSSPLLSKQTNELLNDKRLWIKVNEF